MRSPGDVRGCNSRRATQWVPFSCGTAWLPGNITDSALRPVCKARPPKLGSTATIMSHRDANPEYRSYSVTSQFDDHSAFRRHEHSQRSVEAFSARFFPAAPSATMQPSRADKTSRSAAAVRRLRPPSCNFTKNSLQPRCVKSDANHGGRLSKAPLELRSVCV